jgi:hypothetical protein
VLLGAGEYLGNALGNCAVDLIVAKSAPWDILPIMNFEGRPSEKRTL